MDKPGSKELIEASPVSCQRCKYLNLLDFFRGKTRNRDISLTLTYSATFFLFI